MKAIHITLIVILSLIFLSLASILIQVTIEGEFNFMGVSRTEENIVKSESVSIKDIDKLTLKLTSGDVYIYEALDEDFKLVQYGSKKIKEGSKFSVTKTGNELTFKEEFHSYFMFFNFGGNHIFELYIPKSYCNKLNIEAVSSKVTIEGDFCTSNFDVKTTSGDINAENAIIKGEGNIKVVSGNINLGSFEGNMNIKSTSGNLAFESIVGNVTAQMVSGRIKGETLIGSINSKITSGSTSINHFEMTGDSSLKAVSGNVNLNMFKSNCEVRFKSTSGDITLPNNSSIIGNSPYNILEINTTSGDAKITNN